MTDVLELMRLHVEALFTHDASGRLLSVNTASGGIAPRFFLGRTPEGNLWRFRHDVDPCLVHPLEDICRDEPVGDGFRLPPDNAASFTRVLEEQAQVQQLWAGPAYVVPDSDLAATVDAVVVSDENADVLRPYVEDWLGDIPHCQPLLALLHNGVAVSVCASVRITPGAHEAGVETHRDFRGQGYAPRVVTAWAVAVRRLGAVPLYSTSWENRASQAVARKMGLIQFGADFHVT